MMLILNIKSAIIKTSKKGILKEELKGWNNLNDNDNDLIQLIKMLSDQIEKNINKNIKQYDLTFSQLRIVRFLYKSNGKIYTFKELEKNFGVSQQTMAGLIKRLEMKHFVKIINDDKDKRIKKVELTKKGEEIGDKIEKKRIDAKKWISSTLTNEEKKILYQLIEKIYYSIK